MKIILPISRKKYADEKKQRLIKKYVNDIPYLQRFSCYTASKNGFSGIEDFLANLPSSDLRKKKIQLEDFSDKWSKMLAKNDSAFGEESVYRHFRTAMKEVKIFSWFSGNITPYLISFEKSRAADGDEEYCYCLCGENSKLYFYFIYSGFVIH